MSKASNKAANSKVIDRCFKRLQVDEYSVILDGMEKMAKAGLQYLLEAHESHAVNSDLGAPMLHQVENDTLAWALSLDGRVLRSGNHQGGQDPVLEGSARAQAERIASGLRGWGIVILSDMEGWYREDYEMDFLMDTQLGITEDFYTFFKKVQ